MLNLRKVAVTGTLSSGKSTVCQMFGTLGAYVVSADEIVHKLLSLKSPLSHQILKLLGDDVEKAGVLDRKAIAQKVFQDDELLRKLERLIHPLVFAEMNKHYNKSIEEKAPLFIAEIPLLFETGSEKDFDKVVLVSSGEEECLARFQMQGGSKEDYTLRMQRQLPLKAKEEKSHFVIHNQGDLKSLQTQVRNIFHLLTQEEFAPDEPRRTSPK